MADPDYSAVAWCIDAQERHLERIAYSGRDHDAARRAKDNLRIVANARKALTVIMSQGVI